MTKSMGWRRRGAVALTVVACVVATVGTLAVIAAGFVLSFDAIKAVGEAASINPDVAWLLPVAIDGAMAVATITAIVLRFLGRQVWYPWLVVVVGVVISVWCNAEHAGLRGGVIDLGADTARAVSAIPAVTLFLSIHLLITLALAVVSVPAPVPPVRDIEADMPQVVDTEPDVVEPSLEAPEESPDGAVSGVVFTPAEARTMALALKIANPDMKPAEIGRFVGRSARQVGRMLAAPDASELSLNGAGRD